MCGKQKRKRNFCILLQILYIFSKTDISIKISFFPKISHDLYFFHISSKYFYMLIELSYDQTKIIFKNYAIGPILHKCLARLSSDFHNRNEALDGLFDNLSNLTYSFCFNFFVNKYRNKLNINND